MIVFAYDSHPRYRLVFAANRDEFYERETRPARFWKRAPNILAGKDLRGGGSWTGITRDGRFAAITNFREPESLKNAPSRGFLVMDFLTGNSSPRKYLERIAEKGHLFNGFNLLTGDARQLWYYSNRQGVIARVTPGIHALSNRLLDTPWPKTTRGKRLFAKTISENESHMTEKLFYMLQDDQKPPDHLLPNTGVPLEWERILSSVFISSHSYGSRSSTVLLWERNGNIEFTERTFRSNSGKKTESETRSYRFGITNDLDKPVRQNPGKQ